MSVSKAKPGNNGIDYLTVIALSMLAYTLAVLVYRPKRKLNRVKPQKNGSQMTLVTKRQK